ncbi:MAG: hypothetical protein LBV26_01030 [Bacteroidales bacterium]|nr:hypothetical protein [Bacteroidales bacterium]
MENNRQNLETLVKNMFSYRGAEFTFNSEKLWINSTSDNGHFLPEANTIANQLTELMVLIKYLESQYLAQLYSIGGKQPLPDTPKGKASLDLKEVNLAVYEFYSNHWNDYFYVSDQLRHIVFDNNFKSDNQIYVEGQLAEAKEQTRLAQKQTRNSRITIVISVIALVVSIIAPLHVKAQTQTVATHSVSANILGMEYARELPLGRKFTLTGRGGIAAGMEWSKTWFDNKTVFSYVIVPVIGAEGRCYYNFEKRQIKGRSTAGNSGSFLSLRAQYYFPWGVGSGNANVDGVTEITPAWGLRRVWSGKWLFEFHAGLGFGVNGYGDVSSGAAANIRFGLLF